MIDVPHFSFPFRFEGERAAVVEQDSIDEIADCVLAVLVCPKGYRDELSEFGVSDPAFTSPVDVDGMRESIATWEPRADALIDAEPEALDELTTRVETYVGIRTEI